MIRKFQSFSFCKWMENLYTHKITIQNTHRQSHYCKRKQSNFISIENKIQTHTHIL